MTTERIDILIGARNQASAQIKDIDNQLRALGVTAGHAGSQASSALGQIDSAASALSGGLAGLGAAAFGIGNVVGVLQSIGSEMSELAQRGAIVGQLKDVFQGYAASVGTSSDAILSAMKRASQGTIAESELILNANRAIQFQVAQTPQALAKLVELSSALGRAQGISDQEALGFLTTGIARESRLILDNLGLIVDLEEATASYAATLGKAAGDLTEVERKQAILNEAYQQGEIALRANRDAADSPATRIERFNAAKQDLQEQAGLTLANTFSDSIEAQSLSLREFNDEAFGAGVTIDTLNAKIAFAQKQRSEMAKPGGDGIFGIDFGQTEAGLQQIDEAIADLRRQRDELLKAKPLQLANPEDFFAGLSTVPLSQVTGNAPLQIALEGAPEIIREVANNLRELGNTPIPILAKEVLELKGNFEELGKVQGAVASSINNNAIKIAPQIGTDKALELATQQTETFNAKFKELIEQSLTGEIDTSQLLFQLQALPGQATEIFGQVANAAKDGGVKLQENLAGLINLRDAFQAAGNDAGVAQLQAQISELRQVLAIVAPASAEAADGLRQIGPATQEAASGFLATFDAATSSSGASSQFGAEAAGAASDVNMLVGALAGAPPALAAAGAAMIAAGADASTAAAMVAGLTAEFNQLAGAQAGARRAIIQRAAAVADIVGPQKALELANQEITKSEAAYKALGDGLIAAGDGSVQFEFDLAMLGTTTTSTFDEIEEADRKAKQLAREGLSAASKAANQAEKDFESLKGKVAGVLSGALNLDVGVDTEKILGREDAINEDARRLADVAVKGFDSPWAQYLADKFPDTIGAAFANADPKTAAAQLLRDFEDGLRPELLDKEKAKERVRRALVGEENMAQLAAEIAQELSSEFGGSINLGRIQAVAGTTLGVDGAEADQLKQTLTSAASGVQQQLSGLGGSLKSGILSALEGIGEAVTGALDKQFRSEGNLKTIRSAGATNGEAWGSGFLDTVGENVPPKLVEILATLVTPAVEAMLNRNAQLQGAN